VRHVDDCALRLRVLAGESASILRDTFRRRSLRYRRRVMVGGKGGWKS
jgi:hypothetical protein